jgi:shikimate dehydrogenase
MDIYAVTGNPVAHSLSPRVFNCAFSTAGIDAVYTRLAADTAKEALEVAKQIGIRGLNVTAPFKENMAALVDTLDPDSREIGAVNGVLFSSGRALGFNTDHQGVTGAFYLHGVKLRGKKVAVLGAGGAGRAAVYALMKAGAKVRVVNRTFSKAKDLADRFGCKAESIEHLAGIVGSVDILVSAISQNESLVKPEWLLPDQVILDANYRNSRLSEIALRRGCRVVSGTDWLISQAVAAFEIFLGRPIEYAAMKNGLSSQSNHSDHSSGISLVGMMGTGKTTVGKKLASTMGLELIDTDKAIEEEAGVPISRIFELQGEDFFRTMENRMIRKIKEEPRKKIYALGGGAVSNPENRKIIKDHNFVVWLWAGPQKILERISAAGSRPLMNVTDKPGRLAELISGRLADYASASDLIINAAPPPEKIVRKIIDEVH